MSRCTRSLVRSTKPSPHVQAIATARWALDEHDEAIRTLTDDVHPTLERLEAQRDLAHMRLLLARWLTLRGRSADHKRARALLRAARDGARQLHMSAVVEQCDALLPKVARG